MVQETQLIDSSDCLKESLPLTQNVVNFGI